MVNSFNTHSITTKNRLLESCTDKETQVLGDEVTCPHLHRQKAERLKSEPIGSKYFAIWFQNNLSVINCVIGGET
jgi:hypothetical protein